MKIDLNIVVPGSLWFKLECSDKEANTSSDFTAMLQKNSVTQYLKWLSDNKITNDSVQQFIAFRETKDYEMLLEKGLEEFYICDAKVYVKRNGPDYYNFQVDLEKQ